VQDYTLRIVQGDTFKLQVNYQNPDGTPINMTGYTVVWYIAANGVVFSKTESTLGVFTPATGSMLLRLTSAETTTIPLGSSGSWYLRITDLAAGAGLGVTTIVAGPVEVGCNG
jgi:hypothetical protein